MIIEAVLLSVAKLVSKRKPNYAVAIFPDMRLDKGEGIVVSNHLSGYGVRLTGTVDYGVILYPLGIDNKGFLLYGCLFLD
jgi:hypothetical protein